MDAGATLYVPDQGASYDSHLWMIISDPKRDSERLLIVNFTSWEEWKDQACVVNVNDHPYLRHRSCINYPGAKLVSLAQLHQLKDSGLLKLDAPLSAELLGRIRKAVADSKMKMEYANLLLEQGVIDDL